MWLSLVIHLVNYHNKMLHKEVVYREKTFRQALKVKVPISVQGTGKKRRGRPIKYEVVEIPVKIHLPWPAKRAHKDKADRERILERLKISIHAIKREIYQSLYV